MFRFFQREREAFFARKAREAAKSELVKNGFKMLLADPSAVGLVGAIPTRAFSADEVDAAFAAADAKGLLSDQSLLDAAEQAGVHVSAIGGGGILASIVDFFKGIIDWLSDPANQSKIEAVIKFIMTILTTLGLLAA